MNRTTTDGPSNRRGPTRQPPARSAPTILDWEHGGEITVRRRGRFSDCRAELMCEIEILLLSTGLRDAIRLALLADLVRRTERRIIDNNDAGGRAEDRQAFRLALERDLRRLLRRYRGSPCAPIIDALLISIPA